MTFTETMREWSIGNGNWYLVTMWYFYLLNIIKMSWKPEDKFYKTFGPVESSLSTLEAVGLASTTKLVCKISRRGLSLKFGVTGCSYDFLYGSFFKILLVFG